MWERVFGNIATTVVGMAVAAATYTVGVGGKLPSNPQEWAMAGASVFLAGIGAVMKTPAALGGQQDTTKKP